METKDIVKIILLTSFLLILTFFPSQQFLAVENAKLDLNSSTKISTAAQLDIAHSSINITLTEDNFKYVRSTFIQDVTYEDDRLLNSFTVVDLTTHGDLLIQFHMEFDASIWNNNLTEFRNSPDVNDYKTKSRALNELASLNTSLLGIISTSFETHNFTREDFVNPEDTLQIFMIDQKVVIRETIGFILSLNELFRFDLNSIQLGAMSDFHMDIFYSGEDTTAFFEERLRIQAPGSPLVSVKSTKGYSGAILFSEFEPQRIEKFHRHGIMSDQEINFAISLPREQSVSAKTYFGDRMGDDLINAGQFSVKDNEFFLFVTSEDWLPSRIAFTSEIPFLEQFSLTDYGSMAVALFTGGFALLRGLPFILRQRNYNSFKKNVFSSIQSSDPSSIIKQQEFVKKKLVKRKISAKQYEDIVHELKVYEEAVNNKQSSIMKEKAPQEAIEEKTETF